MQRVRSTPGVGASLVPVLVMLLAAGCTVEAPQTPDFRTSIHLPLGSQKTSGRDLIHDSEFIQSDPADSTRLAFVMEGNVPSFTADSLLDVAMPGSSFEARLNTIEIEPPTDITRTFPQRMLNPAIPPGSQTMPVPAFSFSDVRQEAPPQESFEWMRLERGQMLVHVRNELAVPLSPVDGRPALGVALWDRVNGGLVREWTLNQTLGVGEDAVLEADLAGAELHSRLEVVVSGESPGSGRDEVEVNDAQSVIVTVSFHSLAVDAVDTQEVPAQRMFLADSISLGDDVRIQQGAIGALNLSLVVSNELPLAARALLRFPQIRKGRAQAYTHELRMDPAGGNTIGIDLDGATVVDTTGAPMHTISSIQYTLLVESDPSHDRLVQLRKTQRAYGDFEPARIRFDTFTGSLDHKNVAVPRTETGISPPDGLEDLGFVAADLDLRIVSTFAMSSSADLVLEGVPEDGPPVQMQLQFPLPAASRDQPETTLVRRNQDDSPIVDLIHSQPRKLVLGGTLTMGKVGEIATLERTDTIQAHYTVTAPMRARIGTLVRQGDVFDFELDSGDRENIREYGHGQDGYVVGEVENHFPVRFQVTLLFAESPAQLTDTLQADVKIRAATVQAGRTDAAGRVVETSRSSLSALIRSDAIDFFSRERPAGFKYYGTVLLRAMGEDPDKIVQVSVQDYIDVRAVLQFNLNPKRDEEP